MKKIRQLLYLQAIFFCVLLACSGKKGNNEVTNLAPLFVSSNPSNGEKDVSENTSEIVLLFNENVTLASTHNIMLNVVRVTDAKPGIQKEIKIPVSLLPATDYMLRIPAKAVKGPTGVFIESEINISFSTSTPPVRLFSVEAKKVMDFLYENYGKKTISGAMANVSWNINEADWVHQHTGKYPALNCFDFIHLPFSPANWIDYGNTQVVENWWSENGLVAAMWHWNVPANSGEKDIYSFYYGAKPEETLFDIAKISDIQSAEYKRIIDDIDKISGYLKLLKDKNIPVIWRPLHEAAGNTNAYAGGTAWFWWGAKGAEPFKKLWELMFDRMTNLHNLNNLIWVWTSENNDPEWYPGDQYVDIIGRDLYNISSDVQIFGEFTKLKEKYPRKIIALSECGTVIPIRQQWTSGATWSWFMPWYDYQRTNNPQEADFLETSHQHANIDWWKNAFSFNQVITRDQMPNLK